MLRMVQTGDYWKLCCLMYDICSRSCRQLVMEHTKRATNHNDLLEALKLVNTMIQHAARLRLGAPKAQVVAACRAAIKANNTSALLKIIREGRG